MTIINQIYFVAETKGTTDKENLRGVELLKTECATKHFKAISGDNIKYKICDTYQSFLSSVIK